MDNPTALALFQAQLPETGSVPYPTVYDAMQATAEGRQALERFHALRRNASIPLFAKVVSGVLQVSRQPFPAE